MLAHGEGLQTGLSLASYVAVRTAKDGCASLLRAPCPPPVRSLGSVSEKSQQECSGARLPGSLSFCSCRRCSNSSSSSRNLGSRESGDVRDSSRRGSRFQAAKKTSRRAELQAARRGQRERAKYGLRGRRLGEASHPGPRWRHIGFLLLQMWSVACLVLQGGAMLSCGRANITFEECACSHRDRHARLERRQLAKLAQLERAAYEIYSSAPFASTRLSRGTTRLLRARRNSHAPTVDKAWRHHGLHETARYGLRARRVGEASNPGPEFQRRSQILHDAYERQYGAGRVQPPDHELRAATAFDNGIRDAVKMLVALAARARAAGDPSGSIPACVRHQRWSAWIVPFVWLAASDSELAHPLLQWVARTTMDANEITSASGEPLSIAAALQEGVAALRAEFRSRGIDSKERLVTWARDRGYGSTRLDQHIHWQCQEFILDTTIEADVAVANLELAFIGLAMHFVHEPALVEITQEHLNVRRHRLQPNSSSQPARMSPSANGQPTAAAWNFMRELDLDAELRKTARTVRDPPRWFRGCLRQAFLLAMRSREHHEIAAWKLFVLTPRMLLGPTQCGGDMGKRIFQDRMRRFQQGDWASLLEEAASEATKQPRRQSGKGHRPSIHEQAERKVQNRELSRARTLLTSSGLAPGNQETLEKLRKRPCSDRPQAIPAEALQYQPTQKLQLDRFELLRALRSAGRGSAQDLAGMRYEHLRVLLDDDEAWEAFSGLAQDFARADVPAEVMSALRMGRLTALRKKEDEVRGIVAGSILRRLVCKALSSQFSDAFMARTAPYQFALQTRAGTDSLAHALRFVTDKDEHIVVVSLDGVGAFDHVRRSAFFSKLLRCEELRGLLPLVSALYGDTSRFIWTDDAGIQHEVRQTEGGEQGCPLMPALFSLAQHDALESANQELLPDERILAFLDDLYIITSEARAAEAFTTVASHVHEQAGVQSHEGKLKVWSRGGGDAPADLLEINEHAWTASLPDVDNGIVVLGVPLGKPQFVSNHARKRMEAENKLLQQLPRFNNPQVAWDLLAYCAVPRANHTLRTLPPSESVGYAAAHDTAVWQALVQILGAEEHGDDPWARDLALLPARLGGLGLRSAQLTAEAAYLASWVDALPVLAAKTPDIATAVLADLERQDGPEVSCMQEVAQAREHLVQRGASELPQWHEALTGAEAPQPDTNDDVESARGWQWYACSTFENHFLEHVLKPGSEPARRALLLSQGGSGGAWLRAIPSERVFGMSPLRFQVAMRRRLRWPLPLTRHTCRGKSCRVLHDALGDHPASCPRSGLLKLRSRPVEKVWARICREAGARVRENVLLHEAGVPVDPSDGRKIEVVATGLPVEQGIPLAIDATLVSPLGVDGVPRPGAADDIGVALGHGRRDKRRTYPELLTSSQLRLVVAGIEVGGRTSHEVTKLLGEMSAYKARSEPEALRSSAARAWRSRWAVMLSVVTQDALAATLVDDGVDFLDAVGVGAPLSADVWLDER